MGRGTIDSERKKETYLLGGCVVRVCSVVGPRRAVGVLREQPLADAEALHELRPPPEHLLLSLCTPLRFCVMLCFPVRL